MLLEGELEQNEKWNESLNNTDIAAPDDPDVISCKKEVSGTISILTELSKKLRKAAKI